MKVQATPTPALIAGARAGRAIPGGRPTAVRRGHSRPRRTGIRRFRVLDAGCVMPTITPVGDSKDCLAPGFFARVG